MSKKKTPPRYRIFMAWDENPERTFSLSEVYSELQEHCQGEIVLEYEAGSLCQVQGTNYFLQKLT